MNMIFRRHIQRCGERGDDPKGAACWGGVWRALLVGCFLALSVVNGHAERGIQASISFPLSEMLIRANVPIFGTAYVPAGEGKLKHWYLEYGAGRNPTQWTKIKESDQPVTDDPYPEGKVVWNVNKEPTGNLTNWAVGLTSYRYANWSKNLNGIYTLRLVVEAEDGRSTQTSRTFYIGEALIRLMGGTGLSDDVKCRLLVSSFSFGGEQARVVVIVKQLPPADMGKCRTVTGVEETEPSAAEIYRNVPREFQLQSAIYRIYPNGLKTDPPASLEIDFDAKEWIPADSNSPGSSPSGRGLPGGSSLRGIPASDTPVPAEDTALYQWNPVARLWIPLTTHWFGQTARADAPSLSDYVTYVALLKRVQPVTATQVEWEEISALSGFWNGKTQPGVTVKVTAPGGANRSCVSDDNGHFRLPFQLTPGLQTYRFELLSAEGKTFAGSLEIAQKSGEVALPQTPSLRLLGEDAVSANDKVVILCQDSGASNPAVKEKRSLLAQVQTADYAKKFTVELAETVPGMGNFIGCILPRESRGTEDTFGTGTPFPANLAHGEKLVISVGGAAKNLTIKDSEPPRVTLKSVTHPCLLFATPQSDEEGRALLASLTHSQSRVQRTDGVWKLMGIPGEAVSARVVRWEPSSFTVKSWPFIGFTYKLYHPTPWQLLLRSEKEIRAFPFSCKESWFDTYSTADPLKADGNWHYWQRNLSDGPFKQIDSIAFGSWIKTGFLRVEPGFLDASRDNIQIKSLWIGRSYGERTVEIAWSIEDASPLAQLDWWVDMEAVSQGPENRHSPLAKSLSAPPPKEGRCTFALPEDGKWFFHLRTVDAAKNASSVISYPLVVYSTLNKISALAERATNEHGVIVAEWKQPDGTLQIKLPKLGAALNPATLSMRVFGKVYPFKNVNWDSSTETLSVAVDSFEDGFPLGFDQEILSAQLEGNDMAGKPISAFPALELKISSPFQWRKTSDGGVLKIAGDTVQNPFIGFWKNPMPPWMREFPGCVNNVLVLVQKDWDKARRTRVRGERVIQIHPEEIPVKYWREEWLSPVAKSIALREMADKLVFAFDGSPAVIPGRILPQNLDKNSWGCAQSPTDAFEPGTLRLMTRQPGGFTTLSRVTQKEALTALNTQTKATLRLDGWLPPGEGYLFFKASGNRTVAFATDGATTYRKALGNEVRIDATKNWTRFSILITPLHNMRPNASNTLKGLYYW